MHQFTHGDVTVDFTVLSGEVVGSEKMSETHITSTGGNGQFDSNGQPIAVHINSVMVINHEFWIRTADGIEHDVNFRGLDIPLRSGQDISLISAVSNDRKKLLHTHLQNQASAKTYLIRDGKALNTDLGLSPFRWKPLLIAFALWIGLGLLAGVLGFLVGTGYYIYECVKGSKRKKLLISELDAFLARLNQQVESNYHAGRSGQVQMPEQPQAQAQAQPQPQPQPQPQATAEPAGMTSSSVRKALSRNG
ncbi:hypothetical protein [Pseudomonas sp. PB106]|uniref:hypothetical protein n=1 Tax=Pseudomonas sp. PB106 TaxID=2494699 RepID=UPI00131C5209|nr:hypothetical protein [Pseudomonas sp. PB106]KAE9647446.1 hypothetical protein EJA71_06835 [Pseudomonas sp. PB106]